MRIPHIVRSFLLRSHVCLRLAYHSGVTTGIVAPQSTGFLAGLSTAFSTVAHHKLEMGAIVQEIGALHVSIHPVGIPSVSTQIAALRRLLLGETTGELKYWLRKVKQVRLFQKPTTPNCIYMMLVNRVTFLSWWMSKARTRLHPLFRSRRRSKRTSTTRSKSRSSAPQRRISSLKNSDKPTSVSSSSARGRSPTSGRSGECKRPTYRSPGVSLQCTHPFP